MELLMDQPDRNVLIGLMVSWQIFLSCNSLFRNSAKQKGTQILKAILQGLCVRFPLKISLSVNK